MPNLNLQVFSQTFPQTKQVSCIEFAFGTLHNDVYTNTMPFVTCRGYLEESIYWYKNKGKKLDNWGALQIKTTYVQEPLLLVRNCVNTLEHNIKFLHELEEKYGVEKTKLVVINENYLALHFDPKYLYNTIVFSWLAQTVRLLSYRKIKTAFVKEIEDILTLVNTQTYTESSLKATFNEYISLQLDKLFVDTPCVFKGKGIRSSTIHSYGGIQSYLSKYPLKVEYQYIDELTV